MSEVKHTPGPWAVMPEESDKPYVRIRGTQLGERFKVANVLMPDYEGAQELEIEETRANAHLIAAAPELLEALRDLIGWVPGPKHWHTDACPKAVERAVAAIAKATRGQS